MKCPGGCIRSDFYYGIGNVRGIARRRNGNPLGVRQNKSWEILCIMFLTLAFVIKGIFIVFGALGMATMWEAVFADMGTALLAVFNSTRILRN